MKKVLLGFDGTNFSEGAFEFVRQLNALEPVLVTGVFLPQVDYANLWSYAAAAGAGAVYTPLLEDEEADLVNRNIQYFKMLCKKHNIQCKVHKDVFEFALTALSKETRFADLLVLSGELFYRGVLEWNQMDYLSDVLHNTECPVVIVPEKFSFPQTNILAYDGSSESVYAIKQYAYLFPQLTQNKSFLVFAHSDEEKDIPSRTYISELTAQHFPELIFHKITANPRRYFATWASSQKAPMLVCGSFGRSGFSQLFRRSFVNDVLKEHRVPVFIAHK